MLVFIIVVVLAYLIVCPFAEALANKYEKEDKDFKE